MGRTGEKIILGFVFELFNLSIKNWNEILVYASFLYYTKS